MRPKSTGCTWQSNYCKYWAIQCKDCDYFNPNKEKQMEDKDKTVEFKVKDIKKAYDNGCEDVKKVLKDMCPEVFEEEYCCEWMKKMVEEYEIFIPRTIGTQSHPLFINNSVYKRGYITENGLYYCPRCGKKL